MSNSTRKLASCQPRAYQDEQHCEHEPQTNLLMHRVSAVVDNHLEALRHRCTRTQPSPLSQRRQRSWCSTDPPSTTVRWKCSLAWSPANITTPGVDTYQETGTNTRAERQSRRILPLRWRPGPGPRHVASRAGSTRSTSWSSARNATQTQGQQKHQHTGLENDTTRDGVHRMEAPLIMPISSRLNALPRREARNVS